MLNPTLRIGLFASVLACLLVASGCGSSQSADQATTSGGGGKLGASDSNLSGTIKIDGSETVFPIVDAMGEDFHDAHNGVSPVVSKSGTGSGFQKFIRGDIDIANASRPIMSTEEESLKKANIEYLEIPIAYDGVCVVVNPGNTSVSSLSPAQLKQAWQEGSRVTTWADLHAGWPGEKINFYGPTDNHGTYDYFTETIDGKKADIRTDYQPNQDYNVVIQSVAGDKDGIGYCGLNYYLENQNKVKAVAIDGGKGPVMPSEQSVDDGSYTPLSRPLFIYVNKTAYARPEVKAFVDYALSPGGASAVKEAKYVALPDKVLAQVKKRVNAQTAGSIFDKAKPGESTADVLAAAK